MGESTCSEANCDRKRTVRGLCRSHYMRSWRAGTIGPAAVPDPVGRLLAKVEKTEGCWLWTDAPDKDGYGKFLSSGLTRIAHRVSYELFVGPIPEGLELDHVCHTEDISCPGGGACPHRRCVNPAHLEPVTRRENALRGRSFSAAKTHCPQSHPYDEENTYTDPRGRRHCRACHRAVVAQRKSREKAAA